jgi:hypothetical protein
MVLKQFRIVLRNKQAATPCGVLIRLSPAAGQDKSCRMGIGAARMVREIGIAVAVLALYVLTLLLPLHQAAGLQRDLDALGFAPLDSWSVCSSLVQDGEGDPADAAALTCPAVGVGKQQMAATLPPALTLEPPSIAIAVRYAPAQRALFNVPTAHVGQSRAPPVTV